MHTYVTSIVSSILNSLVGLELFTGIDRKREFKSSLLSLHTLRIGFPQRVLTRLKASLGIHKYLDLFRCIIKSRTEEKICAHASLPSSNHCHHQQTLVRTLSEFRSGCAGARLFIQS
ncbi:hypothetical protein PoB_003292600 [Plakobranchus ocellatus]|uniref:Uncharacterized protein n=1 Tax=Plakobranchus ocellatus TaxID=259542 RepID=A0AAV4AII0_9GAST|nr:hypothetical protein PoB_003292600 [Plakobranchus ocellatus]